MDLLPVDDPRIHGDHRKAARLLAAGYSKRKTAEAVGCNYSTLGEWSRREWFQRLVRAECERRLLADEDEMFSLMNATAEVLREDLKSQNANTRLRAAKYLTSLYGPSYEAMVKRSLQENHEREMQERTEKLLRRRPRITDEQTPPVGSVEGGNSE